MVEDRKLTEIINEGHENVKYLPGVELPSNLLPSRNIGIYLLRYAVPDVKQVVKDVTRNLFLKIRLKII